MNEGMTGIVPTMNVGDGDGCGGWNGMIWLFAILALFGGGFGGGFGGNGNSNAIQNDVNRGFDNQNLQAQTRDILSAVTSGTAQTISASTQNAQNAINAIKDGNASLIREFGNVESAITALSGKQQECCCNTLRAIDGVQYADALNTASINANIADSKYASALNTASINETTTAVGQKILDAITGNRMADMQNQINALQLQNAVAGVVRYPTATTYSSGVNPFCSCACGMV